MCDAKAVVVVLAFRGTSVPRQCSTDLGCLRFVDKLFPSRFVTRIPILGYSAGIGKRPQCFEGSGEVARQGDVDCR